MLRSLNEYRSGARRADRGGFLNHRVSGRFPRFSTSSDPSSATNCGAVLHSTQGPHIARVGSMYACQVEADPLLKIPDTRLPVIPRPTIQSIVVSHITLAFLPRFADTPIVIIGWSTNNRFAPLGTSADFFDFAFTKLRKDPRR